MKAVILPTNTGQGHNSASRAIKGYLDTQGCETIISDVLKSHKKETSQRVSSVYTHVTTHAPWLFKTAYDIGAAVSSSKHHSPIYYLNAHYGKELYQKLTEMAPDIIVCPHIFSAQVLTYIRQKYHYNVPAVGLITDYTCSPFWEETRLDSYIIPAPELTDEFANKGIPREKLFPLGIPVEARYKAERNPQAARHELGISAEKVVLIMGGSMGFGKIPQIAAAMHTAEPGALIIAVCGNNRSLYNKINGLPGVMALQYSEKIDLLLDAADILLTKPGGLSMTEAATKRIPIVFTCPIPGCESVNSDFFGSLGMAKSAKTPRQAAEVASRLLRDPAACERMIDCQIRHISKQSEKAVGNHLFRMAKQKTMV